MIARTAILLVAAAVCTGCYDRFDPPPIPHGDLTSTFSIAELHDRYYGKPFVINEEAYIAGRVTSDDRAGNFYRTFTICDDSGGAEIMAGINDIHSIYPMGCIVRVNLRGCAASESFGILQIGLPAEKHENSDVDYFYSKVNLDRYLERGSEIVRADIPVLHCDELNRSMCGCPITVSSLSLVSDDVEPLWQGYRLFEDDFGNRIYTYTSSYADFADERVPDGTVSIMGILQYGRVSGTETFILKMRTREDCISDNY